MIVTLRMDGNTGHNAFSVRQNQCEDNGKLEEKCMYVCVHLSEMPDCLIHD